jgi:hypothetical protein
VGLESGVDLSGAGASRATTLDTVVLVDAGGAVLATGTPSGRTATVSLDGVPAGDAFLVVNGLTDFPVPVRIEDPAGGAVANVGESLVDVEMGTWIVRWRIRTYPAAAGGAPVVGWSDGAPEDPALHAWVVVEVDSALIEVHTLETGALLVTAHGVAADPAGLPHLIPDSWVFGVHGAYYQENHAQCQGCHGDTSSRAATYAETAADNGWCFACHRGPEGPVNGFVDPTH